MDERLLFNEALSSLMEYATANGGQIKQEDVKRYFSDLLKEDSQYDMVYQYLGENKVKIEGIELPTDRPASDEDELSDSEQEVFPSPTISKWEKEEEALLKMYKEELEHIQELTEEQLSHYFQEFRNGDNQAKNILAEHFLHHVLDIVPLYQHQGVSTADLIQEGNLGMLLALSECEQWSQVSSSITEAIHHAMKQVIEEQNGSTRIDQHLVSRINALNDATTELAKKLDREPTLEELSKHLSLPEDEIRTLMKISMDALTLNTDDTEYSNDMK